MLLCIDIGNSNIVIGVFENKLIKTWRIATFPFKTSDEYGLLIKSFLQDYKINGGIYSSVVPSLDKVFEKMFKEFFNVVPIKVTHKLNLGIKISYPNPEEIGSDRLVNASAAVYLYKSPVIIIDFGTAITFCYVNSSNEYMGGLILPGLPVMIESLHLKTAKLPSVEPVIPNWVIGDSTVKAIQGGLFYQIVGSIEYIVKMWKKKFKNNCNVVITGGYAYLFIKNLSFKLKYEPELTMIGLKRIYELNKEKYFSN